jgi:hypothetical protein
MPCCTVQALSNLRTGPRSVNVVPFTGVAASRTDLSCAVVNARFGIRLSNLLRGNLAMNNTAPPVRLALLLCAFFSFGFGQVAAAEESAPRKLVEIYKVAPGQHVAFLKMIAQFDAASKEAGIPPRDLYVHQDGANWDFMLIQNADYTDEQSAKLGKALERMGLPRGANFFVEFRKLIAEHTDTFVEGPTTAQAWLGKLK